MAGTKTVACGVPHGATEGTPGVRPHRCTSVHLCSGVDIEVQDGVLLSFPFAHSCVLATRTRSLTSQGGGMTVLGTRRLFLCFAGSDVLVAESEDLLENDTDEGVIFISSLLSFLRFAFG